MSYAQYHEWLFPGDPVLEPNPLAADASVGEILDDVSCQTGIEPAWLERSIREVLDGLAGLGCLWFLHGARGRAKDKLKVPDWLGLLVNFIHEQILYDPDEQRRGLVGAYVVEETADVTRSGGVNWLKGTVTFEKGYRSRKPVVQTYKLGRFIDKFVEHAGFSEAYRKEMHHDLKWRAKVDEYDFVVSCSPYDVLTMSHGRPWASCMKPGGMFEYGPLTDMAAGSAVVWFYQPGADQPCGRVILRPFLDVVHGPQPAIATGGRLYGSGPDVSTDALNEMLAPWLQGVPINHVAICPRGRDGWALTRGIYSDTDRLSEGCRQDQEEYDYAYNNLGAADWPVAQFDLGAVAEAARAKALGYEYRDEDEGVWRAAEEEYEAEVEEALHAANAELLAQGSQQIGDWYLRGVGDDVLTVYDAVMTPDGLRNDVEAYVREAAAEYSAFGEYSEEPDPEIYDDFYDVLWNAMVQHLDAETSELTCITTRADQTVALRNEVMRSGQDQRLVRIYPPEDVAAGLDHDPDTLSAYFNMERDAAGRYVDEDSGEAVDAIFLMPYWLFHGEPRITEHVNDATTLYSSDNVEADDARRLSPNPLDWLDDLLRRAG